tara:strand:- start:603 stop:788 length:186 start_codon:yes stop_codon:yes gene_type:complete
MEFKKSISVDSSKMTYWLSEPVIINYSEIFVKIKYWYPHSNHDNKVVKELIINYNVISSGE